MSRASRSLRSNKTEGVKKPKATPREAAGSRRETEAAKGVQQRKSPAKARAAKPNSGKAKMVFQKTELRKAVARK